MSYNLPRSNNTVSLSCYDSKVGSGRTAIIPLGLVNAPIEGSEKSVVSLCLAVHIAIQQIKLPTFPIIHFYLIIPSSTAPSSPCLGSSMPRTEGSEKSVVSLRSAVRIAIQHKTRHILIHLLPLRLAC